MRAWGTSDSRATMLEEQTWGDKSPLIPCTWRIKPNSLGLTWKDSCYAEYLDWVVIQSSVLNITCKSEIILDPENSENKQSLSEGRKRKKTTTTTTVLEPFLFT